MLPLAHSLLPTVCCHFEHLVFKVDFSLLGHKLIVFSPQLEELGSLLLQFLYILALKAIIQFRLVTARCLYIHLHLVG